MPFDPLVTAVVETTLNTLIKDDDDLVKRLARLKGKVISLNIKEFGKTLTFVFSTQLDVLAQYEGEPDCYLSVSLSVLPELREQANITKLIKQDKLVLEGDIQLAQKFSQLLTDCKPDIEEWLSRVTGDVVAHTLSQGAKDVFGFMKTRFATHQNHLGQVLTEEWEIAPAPLEIAAFCDAVDDVKSGTEQLQARLDQVLARANSQDKGTQLA